MKRTLLAFLVSLSLSSLFAQQNLQLVSHLDFVSLANDVWGYTAPDGTEYALVGLRSGVSIVSLADPANPVELHFIPGGQSSWRDLKTWGHYAYVTTDQPGTKDGILVIDLSGLPGDIDYFNWTPLLSDFNDTLYTCHNLWIDEFGYAYLSGCNVNSSGVIFLDVFSTPGQPKYAGKNAPVNSHDAYTRDNLLYSAEIYAGQFGVYDVTDKSNPVLLATQPTPFAFSHNVWLSDDSKTLFNTDERGNAPVSSFDVSDLDEIRLLDEFRPPATLGSGVIPHNVHVQNDFLVISFYTDGCVVVDASRPENLVQVGWYDTSTEFVNGFHGAWGAYPFFPSGLIAVSDIENGLFIFQPDYKRACFLEGKITDAVTGAPVAGVEVEIQSSDPNLVLSGGSGGYKTGQPTAGVFNVLFHVKGYFDVTAQVILVNGEVTLLDVEMTPWPSHVISGRVVDETTGKGISGALVAVENHDFQYADSTDADGNFTLPAVLIGAYKVYAGKWGYENGYIESLNIEGNEELVFELAPFYEDNFNLDLGWIVVNHVTGGQWERAVPQGTESSGKPANPSHDSPSDAGDLAYVTGNKGLFQSDDDVDNGATILISPLMQLHSRYNRPVLSFDTWFFNANAATPADDSLTVLVTNGADKILLDVFTETHQWEASSYDLAGLISLTDEVRIIFRTADSAESGHILEAAVDNFKVTEGLPEDDLVLDDDFVKARIFPNPFRSKLTVDYKVERSFSKLSLLVVNAWGQTVEEIELEGSTGTVHLQAGRWVAAPYFLVFRVDGKLSEAAGVMKGW